VPPQGVAQLLSMIAGSRSTVRCCVVAQARIERERAEEAQARREAQAQLKAEREKADRERAEKWVLGFPRSSSCTPLLQLAACWYCFSCVLLLQHAPTAPQALEHEELSILGDHQRQRCFAQCPCGPTAGQL
jgi:hypothetical protein